MTTNMVAHCREGTSDKVYIVSVVKGSGVNPFKVVAKAGRIWKTMTTYPKGVYFREAAAMSVANKIFQSKLNKGYENIESPNYSRIHGHAPLKMSDSWLSGYLESDGDEVVGIIEEPDPEPVPPEAASERGRDWEVVCVNVLGMEDKFDEGATYVAERHAEPDMIFVWDRMGQKQEVFSERFEEV
jgi:hypothetical protein